LALGSSDIHHAPLSNIADDPDPPRLPESGPRDRAPVRRQWWLAIPLVGVLLLLAAALTVVRRSAPDAVRPTAIRFTLPFPNDTQPLDGAQFAPSPDGTAIALAARGADGQSRLWIRRLSAFDWQELPRTVGAAYPFWSPDGRHVGYFANRRLERVDVENGLTQTIADARDGRGATWGIDGDIVFAPRGTGPLLRVSASGGSPQQVTRLDGAKMEMAHLWPRFLADGRRFTYFATSANRRNASYLADLTADERTLIVSDVAAVPAGDLLLFSQNRSLMAQRFEGGSGGRLDDRVETIAGAGAVDAPLASGPGFSASADVLIYRNVASPVSRLVWVDRSGQIAGEIGPPADYRMASLSPDGTRVAVAQGDAGTNTSDLWLLDTMRATSMRLTFGVPQDSTPIWSPDASRIAFVSRRDGRVVLMTTSAAGGGTRQEIGTWPFAVQLTDWSSDGRMLLFTERNPKTGLDVWAMPVMGDGKAQAVVQTSSDEFEARLSPDGRWIAYVSNESGINQVYVRSFPTSGSVWQVSANGGARPRWQRDGRELLFVTPDGMLTAVAVSSGAGFAAGVPTPLLPLRAATGFEVSSERRFLVPMPDEPNTASQLHVVVNWTSELSGRR
jgi:Tol biopolymer transport system component